MSDPQDQFFCSPDLLYCIALFAVDTVPVTQNNTLDRTSAKQLRAVDLNLCTESFLSRQAASLFSESLS